GFSPSRDGILCREDDTGGHLDCAAPVATGSESVCGFATVLSLFPTNAVGFYPFFVICHVPLKMKQVQPIPRVPHGGGVPFILALGLHAGAGRKMDRSVRPYPSGPDPLPLLVLGIHNLIAALLHGDDFGLEPLAILLLDLNVPADFA